MIPFKGYATAGQLPGLFHFQSFLPEDLLSFSSFFDDVPDFSLEFFFEIEDFESAFFDSGMTISPQE